AAVGCAACEVVRHALTGTQSRGPLLAGLSRPAASRRGGSKGPRTDRALRTMREGRTVDRSGAKCPVDAGATPGLSPASRQNRFELDSGPVERRDWQQ